MVAVRKYGIEILAHHVHQHTRYGMVAKDTAVVDAAVKIESIVRFARWAAVFPNVFVTRTAYHLKLIDTGIRFVPKARYGFIIIGFESFAR